MTSDTQENDDCSPKSRQETSFHIRKLLAIAFWTARLFKRHRCMMQASALSYITLVSIVPVTALLLGVSRGCGFDVDFQKNLTRCFIGQEQIAQQILSFADNALNAAHGGIIKGVGVLVLLFTTISFQIKIGKCFQDIWNIRTNRKHGTFFQSLIQFLSDLWHEKFRILLLFLLSPVFALIFIGISGQGIAWLEAIPQIPGKHGLITVIRCVFIPLLFAWGAFWVFYLIFIPSPCCKQDRPVNQIDPLTLRLIPPLIACFPTGMLFIASQYVCMYLQNVLTNYNAIYGKFAAIPVFLIWVQLSWSIVLLGGLIAYMIQREICKKKDINTGQNKIRNEQSRSAGTEQPQPDNPEENTAHAPLSSHYRAVCALRIMKFLGNMCSKDENNCPVSAGTIPAKLNIPRPDTTVILNELKSAGLVHVWIREDAGSFHPDILREKDLSGYSVKIEGQYKADPDKCTPTEVLKSLSKTGEDGSAQQEIPAPDAEDTDNDKQDNSDTSSPRKEGTPPEAEMDSEKNDADAGVMSVEEAETILESLWEKAAENNPDNAPLFSKWVEEENTPGDSDGDPHESDSDSKPGFFGWLRNKVSFWREKDS